MRFMKTIKLYLTFLGVIITFIALIWTGYFRRVKKTPTVVDEHVAAEPYRPQYSHCQLPVLDPFNKEIMKYAVQKAKPSCKKIAVGKVHNGKLIVKLSGVKSLIFYYIKRVPRNDFETTANIWYPLMSHAVSNFTQVTYGCLTVTIKGISYIVALNKKKELILEPSPCYHNGVFQFLGKRLKLIRHVIEGKCLQHSGGRVLAASSCDQLDSESFGMTAEEKLKAATGNQCIAVRDKTLIMDDCSKGARFEVRNATPQDVNIVVSLKLDGIKIETLVKNELITEYHLHAVKKPVMPATSQRKTRLPFNFVFLMYDSQSAANFDRFFPKTMKLLRKNPTSLQFTGHTIVGDGTTAQLCAMLTGVPEDNLPEARRSASNAETVDRWPFIFQDLHKRGYATLFSEDDPSIGTFNYRLYGFKKEPTLHYGRPFWIQVEKENALSNGCLNNKLIHDHQIHYLQSFLENYKDVSKFGFVVTSTVGHNSLSDIQILDDGLSNFLRYFLKSEMEKNTVLVIFGDHGLRVGDVRQMAQGKLEERLPFFSMTVPSWFPQKYPQKFSNARTNTKTLTSHFDVYHTVMDLLESYPVKRNRTEIGMSLFDNIDNVSRSCLDAGVEDHWCPCLFIEPMDIKSADAIKIGTLVVERINGIIKSNPDARSLCQPLILHEVLAIGKGLPNSKVRKFKKTVKNSKCDSCDVVYENDVASPAFIYRIDIRLLPSLATFEASLSLADNDKIKHIDISRTNLYGNQPRCIQKRFPHLRPYCFCKT